MLTIAPLSLVLLVASLAAIFVGPALHHGVRSRRTVLCGIDGFVLVAVVGLVLLHVVPEAVATAGWPAALAAVLGLFGPTFTERRLARVARQAHAAALAIALAGVVLHSVFDGVALAGWTPDAGREQTMLAAAVILHQIPVGLMIWLLLRPRHGARLPLAILGVTAVAVVAGFVLGDVLRAVSGSGALAILQAFVGGSLLHVVMHSGIEHEQGAPASAPRAAGLGALAGAALVALLSLGGGHEHAMVAGAAEAHGHAHGSLGEIFLALAYESAPALVIGYAAAGLVSVFLPHASVAWVARGGPAAQALRGVAFGLPLPICSCGVVPLYRSLVSRGAPAAAAMAFLVATPELGLDAVLLSVPLLGVPLAVARVVAAGLVAVAVGWLVGRIVDRAAPPAPVAGPPPEVPRGARARLGLAVHNGFGETFEATAPWILLGLAVAALADPLLDGGWLRALPAGLEVPLFALLGMPLYICASGATPLVAVLVHQGVSPGAAIAFLLTGPATNVTTFGLLKDLHGVRIAAAFGLVIAALATGLGFATNAVIPPGVPFSPDAAEHGPSLLELASLAVLGLALLVALLRRGPRALVEVVIPVPRHDHDDQHDGGAGHEHGHAGHEHGRGHGEHDHGHAGHDHDHDHEPAPAPVVAPAGGDCCSGCGCGPAEGAARR